MRAFRKSETKFTNRTPSFGLQRTYPYAKKKSERWKSVNGYWVNNLPFVNVVTIWVKLVDSSTPNTWLSQLKIKNIYVIIICMHDPMHTSGKKFGHLGFMQKICILIYLYFRYTINQKRKKGQKTNFTKKTCPL